MIRTLLALAALAVAGCASSTSQVTLGDLRPGEPVRPVYRTPVENPVAQPNMIRQVNGSIEVTAGQSPFRIHLVDLESLQVRRGRATGRGIMVGAVLGSMAGTVAAMACGASCSGPGRSNIGTMYGFLAGASIGTGLGVARAPERWVDVRLR